MASYLRDVPPSEAVCPNCGGALRQEIIVMSGLEEDGRPMERPGMYACVKGDFHEYNLPAPG